MKDEPGVQRWSQKIRQKKRKAVSVFQLGKREKRGSRCVNRKHKEREKIDETTRGRGKEREKGGPINRRL